MRIWPFAVVTVVLASCAPDSPTATSPDATVAAGLSISAQYDITRLGTLGGATSSAADINNDGVVVGTSLTASGAPHAFKWTRTGGMVDLGTLPGQTTSGAIAIADDGTILGESGTATVVWSRSGVISELPLVLMPNATRIGSAVDINSSGTVIGYDYHQSTAIPWIWRRASGKTELTAPGLPLLGSDGVYPTGINELGAVAMWRYDNSLNGSFFAHGWMRTPLGAFVPMGDPSNGTRPTIAVFTAGINLLGVVVGNIQGGPLAFRWSRLGGFSFLEAGGAERSTAEDVNDLGAVAGSTTASSVARTPAMWSPLGRVQNLTTDGAPSGQGIAINNRGTVAGNLFAVNGNNSAAVIWTLHINIDW